MTEEWRYTWIGSNGVGKMEMRGPEGPFPNREAALLDYSIRAANTIRAVVNNPARIDLGVPVLVSMERRPANPHAWVEAQGGVPSE